jgi:hypothetical protein
MAIGYAAGPVCRAFGDYRACFLSQTGNPQTHQKPICATDVFERLQTPNFRLFSMELYRGHGAHPSKNKILPKKDFALADFGAAFAGLRLVAGDGALW